jgi:hypothetical protein
LETAQAAAVEQEQLEMQPHPEHIAVLMVA